MERTIYREIEATRPVWILAVFFTVLLGLAGASFFYVEQNGHIVTGMNNQIVWGLPHVFAIFLIVAASGALNVASIATVFGKTPYKPMARLSALLALALLAGGLGVLVLDLGRPDLIIVAMTKYNFSSIFAWNIYLYTGFFGVVGAYLYVQMARGMSQKIIQSVGVLAFVWRLALTTGTGSIFGWLVARTAYDTAIMAPLFIVMSFSFGLAAFILVIAALFKLTHRRLGNQLLARLGRLLGIFAVTVLYFTAVQHLTNLYTAERLAVEKFLLVDGGIYPVLFWLFQVVIGGLVPIFILLHPAVKPDPSRILLASILIIIGGMAQIYVIVVGGQAFPQEIFPGFKATSSFFDGQINSYTPSLFELLLGIGGVALALAITLLGTRILRILPTNLSDANIDPQHKTRKAI